MPMGRPVFRVQNLGPIAEGEVELRPLTILIGKNNTGKTYMAQAIYAALKAAEHPHLRPHLDLTATELDEVLNGLGLNTPSQAADLLTPIKEKVQSLMRQGLQNTSKKLPDMISIYFDVYDLGRITRWDSEVPLDVRIFEHSNPDACLFSLSGEHESHPLDTDPGSLKEFQVPGQLRFINERLAGAMADQEADDAQSKIERATGMIANYFWGAHVRHATGLAGTARYLPAGRCGLFQAGPDVLQALAQHRLEQPISDGRSPSAVGGIALAYLNELRRMINVQWHQEGIEIGPFDGRNKRNAIRDVATQLARSIGGSIVMRPVERFSLPSIHFKTDGGEVPVQKASSMVAELAPLIGLVGSRIRIGDVLIIDEPEAHLHPEAVLAVSGGLVQLASAGVRVLCTTHSSEFLHTISNCMLRAARETRAPGGGPLIRLDDFAVYDFAHDANVGATVVKPVEIDPEWGIPEDDFFEVANRLSNETARLINDYS